MKHKPRPPGPKVFAAGLVAGFVAAWASGCSKSDSPNINLKQAREALCKRRADYGETSPARAGDKAPVPH